MATTIEKLTAQPASLEEIAFLRFFFDKASYGMGPADSDIYRLIMDDFETQTGVRIPASIREDYYEEEEDNAE